MPTTQRCEAEPGFQSSKLHEGSQGFKPVSPGRDQRTKFKDMFSGSKSSILYLSTARSESFGLCF